MDAGRGQSLHSAQRDTSCQGSVPPQGSEEGAHTRPRGRGVVSSEESPAQQVRLAQPLLQVPPGLGSLSPLPVPCCHALGRAGRAPGLQGQDWSTIRAREEMLSHGSSVGRQVGPRRIRSPKRSLPGHCSGHEPLVALVQLQWGFGVVLT